jgi:hypothetical protein
MKLYVMFVLSLLPLASAVRVELYANETIATFLDYYGVIFFQPEEPPASPMSCSEQSACDGCDSEMACGGSLPLDLSTGGDTLRFVWNAPEDQIIHITGDYTMEASWAGGGSGWITQGGDFGTELELRLDTPNCKAEYQDIDVNTDVTLDFDDGGIGHTQSYQLLKSSVDSFVELRAGCAIHMHMRFEPTNDGILDLKFKKLTITAIYDSQKTAQGEREYTWSTSGSMWIREPAGGSIELLGSISVPFPTITPTTTSAAFTSSTTNSTVDPTEAASTTTTDASTTVSVQDEVVDPFLALPDEQGQGFVQELSMPSSIGSVATTIGSMPLMLLEMSMPAATGSLPVTIGSVPTISLQDDVVDPFLALPDEQGQEALQELSMPSSIGSVSTTIGSMPVRRRK